MNGQIYDTQIIQLKDKSFISVLYWWDPETNAYGNTIKPFPGMTLQDVEKYNQLFKRMVQNGKTETKDSV